MLRLWAELSLGHFGLSGNFVYKLKTKGAGLTFRPKQKKTPKRAQREVDGFLTSEARTF